MQSLTTSVYEAGRNLDSFQVLVVVLGLAVGCQDLSLQKQLCREIASLVLCSKGPLEIALTLYYTLIILSKTPLELSRTQRLFTRVWGLLVIYRQTDSHILGL